LLTEDHQCLIVQQATTIHSPIKMMYPTVYHVPQVSIAWLDLFHQLVYVTMDTSALLEKELPLLLVHSHSQRISNPVYAQWDTTAQPELLIQ